MRLLGRYVGRAMIAGTLLALLVLVSVDTLIDFLGEAGDVGKHGYTLLRAVLYTLFTVPQNVYDFFPTCVLIGSLLGLGTLAGHGELMAMRAAGLSKLRIIRSVLTTGLVMIAVAVLIGELLAPRCNAQARQLKSHNGASGRISLDTRYGLWAKDGRRFINVRAVYPGNRLAHIWIYRLNGDLKLVEATYAASADYRDGYWYLHHLRHSLISEAGVRVRQRSRERWRRLISPDLLAVIAVQPSHMSALDLVKYVDYLKGNHLDTERFELAFWTHFTTPLSSLAMLLLAVLFVFGSTRGGGAGQRLFLGIVIGLVFHLFNRSVNHLSLVYGLPPLLGAALPVLVFTAIALAGIRKVN